MDDVLRHGKEVPLPADLEAVLGRLERGFEDLYGGRYRGLVLYGSYARGEADDESDVDLLLLGGEVDRAREVLRVEPVKWPLALESGYVLSVVPVGVTEFRDAREPFLCNARSEGTLRR